MNRRRFPHRPSKGPTGFRSKFEEHVHSNLKHRGVTAVYEPLWLSYRPKDRVYVPDFVLPNGIYIEVKGYFLSSDRTKMVLVRDQTGIDVRFVFQRAHNRLSKKSKTTYAQWAEKHGFQWAEGAVPEAWIKESKRA